MKPSLATLRKYFRLEADRDYDNGAVLGGLDKILGPWRAEARADRIDEDLIQAVVVRLRDYPRLSPKSRREVLKGLWDRITRDAGLDEGALEPEEAPSAPAESPSRATATPPEAGTASRPPSAAGERAAAEKPEPTVAERPRDSKPAVDEERADLSAPVTAVRGIGEQYAKTLARLEIHTLEDMLYYFPRRYDDYSQLKPINRLWYGDEVTVIGTVESIGTRPIRNRRLQLVEAVVTDGSGSLRVSWFNQPWVAKSLRKGSHVVLSGKVDQYLGRLTMNNPEFERLEKEQLHTNRIVPVYSLTGRLTQRWLRRRMHEVVSFWAPRVEDFLPSDLCEAAELIPLSEALAEIHFPDSWERLQFARQRLAFDEIFLLQLAVQQQKRAWKRREGRRFTVSDEWLEARRAALPFRLTGAQERAVSELRADLESGSPMNRLIQGDVGSGKTVVAALGIAMVVRSGAQAAIMAPTSILAEQHYRSLSGLLAGEGGVLAPHEIRLMIGATPDGEKAEIRDGLADGSIKVVVGTHALIEDPVEFKDLALAVVDEQHRFGVEQRAALRSKGETPHLLVMTATPIPRSLALTVYGDLDLTVIDEMPPGRQLVDTQIVYPVERERVYTFIRSQVESGRQAFIIYPLVEETEVSESRAAVEEHARLENEVFPSLQVGLLHGRLRPEEKESVMAGFRDREYHVLVTTSVVEVGVDIPNATVVLVESANRFGLAQLHQFRGRVGREAHQSYCFLIPESEDAAENERLAAMAETNDGFVLAERDLEQRGPGEFLGTRQSGYVELRLAKLTDVPLIEKARRHARAVFENDPTLTDPTHQRLVETLDSFVGEHQGDVS